MKNTLTIVSLFLFSIFAYAQDDCQEFLDKMAESVKNNEFDKAKSLMKDFITCKEQTLGSNNPILNNLDKINYIREFKNNVAIAHLKEKNKFFICDENLKFTLIEYSYVNDFIHEYAVVQNYSNYKFGLIDKQGNEIFPVVYDIIANFTDDGLALIGIDGKYGYLDINGKLKIDIIYDIASHFKNGIAIVGKIINGKMKFGCINTKNEIIIPLIYDELLENNTLPKSFFVRIVGKRGFIDFSGNIITPLIYRSFDLISENRIRVLNDETVKYGFLDEFGKEIIPCIYSSASRFSNNTAKVLIKKREFFINTKGECVKDCENAPADHPRANN